MTLAEDDVEASAAAGAPLLSDEWSWSTAVLGTVDDALLGFGVGLLRLLVDGVLRGPRGLPLGQPWGFFGFASSVLAALAVLAAMDIAGGGCVVKLSSGGVRVWTAGAGSVTSAGSEGGSGTCATSEG